MSDPKIAIVGGGNLSTKRIYPNVAAAGGQIVGVCDLDLEKAERNARRFGGRAFTDLNVMLETLHPDGVIVCIGPEAHARIATQVLRLGYPVYTEKPDCLHNGIQETLLDGEQSCSRMAETIPD
jgi:predicted dehydrogenase